MQEYTIRINTPADFSGLDGVPPRLGKVTEQIEAVKAATVGARREMSSFESTMAKVDAAIARDKGLANIQGGGASHAEQGSGMTAANAAGMASLGSRVGSMAPQLAAVAAGVGALKVGFDELAETQGAENAMTRLGLSLDDVAAGMEAVEGLEFITGNKVSAAELFARVLNGQVRGLQQYGIELDQNSTREERLAALRTLTTRGINQQVLETRTLAGAYGYAGKSAANFAESIAGAVAEGLMLRELGLAIGDVFSGKFFGEGAAERRLAVSRIRTEQEEAAKASENLAAKEKERAKQEALAAAGTEEAATAVKNLTTRLDESASASASASSAINKLAQDELALRQAKIDKEEAGGQLGEFDARRAKNEANFSAKDEELSRERDDARNALAQIAAEEEKAKKITQPGDEAAGTVGRDPEAASRLRQRGEVEKELKRRREDAELRLKSADLRRQANVESTDAENKRIARDEKKAADDAAAKTATEGERARKESEAEAKKNAAEQERAEREATQKNKLSGSVRDKLGGGTERFRNEFGAQGQRFAAKRAAEDARKRAEERLQGLSEEEQAAQADEILEEEQGRFVRQGRAGKRSLKPREFRSAEDQKGSLLDRHKEMQRGGTDDGQSARGGASKGGDQSQLSQGVKALQSAAAGIQSLGQFVTVAQSLQQQIQALKTKVDAIDTSSSK
jgi:hypothetical protein